MANFNGIIFNEIPMPDFVKVIHIEHSVLPSISQNLLTVGGKAGAYDFGNNMGTREIAVDVTIVLQEENTLPEKLEQLAEWLYYDEAKELILGDNPNRYYIAKFTGDSNIKESFLIGEGTITFTCTDPFIFGGEIEHQLPEDTTAGYELYNAGTSETYPKMEFEITEDLTSFAVVAGEDFIDFGTPFTVDTSESALVDAGGYVLRDQLTSLTGWTVAPNVHSGTVTGAMEVFGGNRFRQAGLDYGTGTGWHGASVIKQFSQGVQDFEANLYFRINAHSTVNHIGTILLKTNLSMRTGTSTKYPIKKVGKTGETYTVLSKTGWGWYKLSNGLYCSGSSNYSTFTAENVDADKLGKVMFDIKDTNGMTIARMMTHDASSRSRSLQSWVQLVDGSKTKTLIKKTIPQQWHDATCYYSISRKSNVWSVKLYFWNGERYSPHYDVKWVDSSQDYIRKADRLQMSVQAYSTYPAVYMELRDVYVKTLDTVAQSNELPLILRAGDVLSIDNERGDIRLNNRPFYQYLNPSSTFIKLRKGSNGISVIPDNSYTNAVVSYTERHL